MKFLYNYFVQVAITFVTKDVL